MPAPTSRSGPDATALMAMSPSQCRAHLRDHRVSFAAASRKEAPEVAQPVRLTGPLEGVVFRIPWSSDMQEDHHAIWDCRLLAAMIPLARWLSIHGVREVHYFSVLRRGRIVKQKPRSQHNIGLAIDILGLVHGAVGSDRSNVEDDYPKGRIRACPPPALLDARRRLWAEFMCYAASEGLVHTLLTPDYDRDHRNHLHLDLQPGQTRPPDPFVSFAGSPR